MADILQPENFESKNILIWSPMYGVVISLGYTTKLFCWNKNGLSDVFIGLSLHLPQFIILFVAIYRPIGGWRRQIAGRPNSDIQVHWIIARFCRWFQDSTRAGKIWQLGRHILSRAIMTQGEVVRITSYHLLQSLVVIATTVSRFSP